MEEAVSSQRPSRITPKTVTRTHTIGCLWDATDQEEFLSHMDITLKPSGLSKILLEFPQIKDIIWYGLLLRFLCPPEFLVSVQKLIIITSWSEIIFDDKYSIYYFPKKTCRLLQNAL
jgi:hypothetical protein